MRLLARTLPAIVTVLLVLLAFALGIASERWLNGERREEALKHYEQAVRDYGMGYRVPRP